MVDFRIETLDGGITQMVISGSMADSEFELFQALSQLSKKCNHILINLENLTAGNQKFFDHLKELSARTKIKVITTQAELISNFKKIGLATFPSVKSASLSYVGDETVNLLLSKLRDVPILNTEAYSLLAYTNQPEASFAKLEEMVKGNPGLCSQILRIANSSFFARLSRAETLQQAMVTLGFINLRQIFFYNFYTSVGNFFKAQKAVISHGRKCAILAEFICKNAGGSAEECAKVRMGGLLHDIGSQALAFFLPKQYEKVREIILTEKKESYIVELFVFGTEHQAVGNTLAAKWNFPPYLSGIIGDHHFMKDEKWRTLTSPVFIANNFLNERENIPALPYFQHLEEYFASKCVKMPWKDNLIEVFHKALESIEDPF